MNITITDIAQMAKVSPATVSLVLNGKPGVGSETRDRVLKIATDCNYKGLLKENSTLKRNTILFLQIVKHGCILNENHKSFIADYIEGAEQEARKSGYSLEVSTYNEFDPDIIMEMIAKSTVRGVIILGTELEEEDLQTFFKSMQPVVFIDIFKSHLPFDFIDMNNDSSVYNVISHLKSLGHEHIGLVKCKVETGNFLLRKESFFKALAVLNLSIDENYIFTVDASFEKSTEDMKELLSKSSSLPTALFCVNDIIAHGCMRALQAVGYKVPEDISVIGFDDLPMSTMMDPPLTTVKVSKSRIGRSAMRVVLQRIEEGNAMPYEKIMIGGELVERSSVKTLKLN